MRHFKMMWMGVETWTRHQRTSDHIHYEISIDLSHIKTFSNELMGEIAGVTFSNQIKTFTTSSRFGLFTKRSIFFHTRRTSFSPIKLHKVIENLLVESNQLPNPNGKRSLQTPFIKHIPRGPKIWHTRRVSTQRNIARSIHHDSANEQTCTLAKSRTQRNPDHAARSNISEFHVGTKYAIWTGGYGCQRNWENFFSHGVQTLCRSVYTPIWLDHVLSPPVPNKTISEVSSDWMLMLAPSVVASSLNVYLRHLKWIALKKEPVSYLANHHRIKENPHHGDPTMLSGSTSTLMPMGFRVNHQC